MQIFGRTVHFSVWKSVLALFVLGIITIFALLGQETFRYYKEIKSGVINPYVDDQIGMSLKNVIANNHVTVADLSHLYSPDAPTLGPKNAKITIVEFLDFDCPFCEESFGPLRQIEQEYPNDIRVIHRDFPVTELHPRALASALAARCANEQGKYWAYHDELFITQDKHEDSDLLGYATAIGLNQQEFTSCYQSQKYLPDIQKDIQDGLQVGVQGTPTFFFNGLPLPGALTLHMLQVLVQDLLAQKPITVTGGVGETTSTATTTQ